MALQPGNTHESQAIFGDLTPMELENKENERINMVREMFLHADNVKKSQESRWQRSYDFYYGLDRDFYKKAGHQSKIFVPRCFQTIETKTPQFVLSVLSKDPVYTCNPQSNDDPYKAKIMEGILTWQIRQMENPYQEHTLWMKDAGIYGGAVAKIGWNYKCEHVPAVKNLPPIIDFMNATIIQQQGLTTDLIVQHDEPEIKNIDIGEIYPDPAASDIEDARFVIHRYMMPYHEVIRMGQLGIYKNTEKIQSNTNTGHWTSEFARRRYSTHNFQDPFQFNLSMYSYVEILECWWVDPTDPQMKKWKTVVANRQYLIQDVPLSTVFWHNRFPFVLLKNIPMTREFWGISDIDTIYMLQKELNSLRNQRMDNMNAMLKAYWIVNRSAGINKEKMKRLAPGDIIHTNSMDGIRAERPPSIDGLTFNSEMASDRDIQMTTGVGDMQTGQPSRSQVRNATTASLLDQAAKTRFGLTALLWLEQMRKVGKDMLALNYQFLDTPVVVSIMGEEGLPMQVPIDRSMIPRNPDVFVTLGQELVGNKEMKRQLMLQFFTLLQTIPGTNLTQYMIDMMKENEFKNPERYFPGGDAITPTEVFFQKMGLNRNSTESSFTSQMGGHQQPNHTHPPSSLMGSKMYQLGSFSNEGANNGGGMGAASSGLGAKAS